MAVSNLRLLRYLQRCAGEALKGERHVLHQKARSLAGLVLAAFLVAVIRLARPVITVRFGRLVSQRIGHYAANTELYLCERDAGMHPKRTLDFFYNGPFVCNSQLAKMWSRKLHLRQFAMRADRLNRRLPGYMRHIVNMPSDKDEHGLLERTNAHLAFTVEEHGRGNAMLREMGVPDGHPTVCFYARDSTYLDTVHNYRSRDDWAYLDYRDADINTYTPAVEELTRRGYFAVRMGAVVKDALTVSHPMIIDYARTSRSEFMDVFLAAQCNFFIGSTGGINSIPTIFRQPVAYVNFIPLGSEHLLLLGPASLLIPKKLWLRRENRFLTFRGTVELGVSGLHKSDRYKQLDLEVMDNSPEEIAAIAMEMDERLKGTWVTTDEDEILQERFRKLFGRQSDDAPPWRIGAAFLRQNQNLLDQ